MKALVDFVLPTVKAIIAVCAFIAGLGWGAYAAVSLIAKTEAQTVRKELLLLDEKNMNHINRRFDKIEALIKEE